MENIKHCYIAIGLLHLSNQEIKQQSLRFKFAEVKNHLRLRKCKKLPQTCGCGPPIAILRNLRLRNRVQICGAQHCPEPQQGIRGSGQTILSG